MPRPATPGLQQVAETKAQKWRQESQAAINAWNAYVEKHDVPLAEYRQF